MDSFGTRLHRDCNAMGHPVETSPCIPSTSAHNAILSVLLIHIIPSHQIYEANDNPSLVPSIPCLTTTSYLWNYLRTACNVSHTEHLQLCGCQCISHMNQFRDGIQVT